jgi:hypothetical protein
LYRFLTPELGASRTNKNQKEEPSAPRRLFASACRAHSEAYCAEQAAEYAGAIPPYKLLSE